MQGAKQKLGLSRSCISIGALLLRNVAGALAASATKLPSSQAQQGFCWFSRIIKESLRLAFSGELFLISVEYVSI